MRVITIMAHMKARQTISLRRLQARKLKTHLKYRSWRSMLSYSPLFKLQRVTNGFVAC